MFGKLSLLSLLPLATALTLKVPTNPTVGETVTISWTSDSSDPSTWSLFLSNPSFRDDLGLQATVQGSSGSTTVEIPDVAPGGSYTLKATAISNITDIIDQTSDFNIGAATSTIASSTASSAASGASSASGGSGSAVGATTTPTSPATGAGATTTTGFGQTVSATDTSGESTDTGSASGSSSAAGSTGSSFSGATVKGGKFVGEATVVGVLVALVGVVGGGLVV